MTETVMVIMIMIATNTQGTSYIYTSRVNTYEISPDATVVEFKDHHFGTIPAAAFSHLSLCRVLKFLNTNTSVIEVDAWLGLSNLTDLVMRHNNIQTLHANSFKHLSRLVRLHFRDNGLVAIEPESFKGLPVLTYLYLSENNLNDTNIRAIESSVWIDISDTLIHLDLSGNGLTIIYENMFRQFSILKYLYVHMNNITSFEPGSFRGLSTLERLYLYDQQLDQNKIAFNDSSVWGDISDTLTALSLSINNFTELYEDMFLQLPNLQELYIDRNFISIVNAGTFNGLSSLFIVNMQNNRLTTLECDAFNLVPFLRTDKPIGI